MTAKFVAPAMVFASAIVALPAQAETVPPAPPATMQYFYWDPGHWHWTGTDWFWMAGHYVERPYTNAYWVPGHWDSRPYGWTWIPGYWAETGGPS